MSLGGSNVYMWNTPNILSLMRIPLAIVFLYDNPLIRLVAVIFAMLSDYFDGFLARYYKQTTRLGTMLDPVTDKFFVIVVLSVFLHENRIQPIEAVALLCRDFSVILFGLYLAIRGQLATYRFKAIWCGKITTTLQFFVLLGLTIGYTFPPQIFVSFLLLGFLALIELYLSKTSSPASNLK